MSITLRDGSRVMRCPTCGGGAFHSESCWNTLGNSVEGHIRKPVGDEKTLINLRFYEEEYLDSFAKAIRFAESGIAAELKPTDFGHISRKTFEQSDAKEIEIVLLHSGSILVCKLYGDHHLSDTTMDEANIVYLGFTPRPEILNTEAPRG